jgi:cation/acetate symporter
MPIAFFGIWLFSKLDWTKRAQLEKKAFEAQFIRSETGIGAATANVH